MIRAIPEDEAKLRDERVRELYTSKWTVDNLVAILMDTHKGNMGFNEDIARVKAHDILSWLQTIVRVTVPEKR